MSLRAKSGRDGGLDFSSVFDVSLDMLCVRDLQGRFVRVNRAWESALGYTVDELEGAPLLPLIHPEDVCTTRTRMKHADQDDDVIGFVNRYRRRDGRYLHLEWRARRMGEVVFGVARDITDRLACEAELRAANRAKSQFLANLSREIRIPLDDVVGLAAALGHTRLTPAQQEMVQRVARSGERLERLLSHALDVSEMEADPLEIELRAVSPHGDLKGETKINHARESSRGGDLPDADSVRETRSRPRATTWRPAPALEGLRKRPDFQRAVRSWTFESLEHFETNPLFHRHFQDLPGQALGFLAIYLDHTGQLHQRGLQSLSRKIGFISAGRTTSLLMRMQDIQFIEPAEAFSTGKARRFRPLPAMVKAFADRLLVDLKSAALIEPSVASAIEALERDEQQMIPLLAAFAEILIEEPEIRGLAGCAPLNGAPLMAMGELIALRLAADAMERRGEAWEGPITVALASYAHQFEVSRAHVRRVLQTLEPCGLARIQDQPNRLLVTSAFRDAVETCYAAMFETILRTIDRYRSAKAAA